MCRQWVLPREADALFVAPMEDVLGVYTRPFDPDYPVLGGDEKPLQLLGDVVPPLPMQPGQVARQDYEYQRRGTANVFLFTEPLSGWRQVTVREQRTAVDWAQEMKALLEGVYAHAQKVILVCDNLNTHKIASFYKAFPPEEAYRLSQRLEIHYTPTHGSWLNVAELELSVLSRQCLDRRLSDLETLRREVTQWCQDRNTRQTGVDWQFTTQDARIKLKRLYPEIKME